MSDTTNLGTSYRDSVTGFTGIATGRAEYLASNPSVRLEAVTEQGDAKERWFSEERLEQCDDRPTPGFHG